MGSLPCLAGRPARFCRALAQPFGRARLAPQPDGTEHRGRSAGDPRPGVAADGAQEGERALDHDSARMKEGTSPASRGSSFTTRQTSLK